MIDLDVIDECFRKSGIPSELYYEIFEFIDLSTIITRIQDWNNTSLLE
jgi:hypothetical protein